MLTFYDKVGEWVKKGQNHDDVILEWSLTIKSRAVDHPNIQPLTLLAKGPSA